MSGKTKREERKQKAKIEKLLTEAEIQKAKLFEESLERHGIIVDKETEARRTFKTLVIKKDKNKDYVLYNDGSVDGKLLLVIETIVNKDDETGDFTLELKPYCTSIKESDIDESKPKLKIHKSGEENEPA